MPRRRPRTALDRYYREPRPLPDDYLAGMEQNVLAVLAEARRLLVERRCRETLDYWKTNARPLVGPVKIPDLSAVRTARESRTAPGYRGHLEEHLDRLIRNRARAQELEDGLAVIRERGIDTCELTQVVERALAGETIDEIALALDVSNSTIQRYLRELRMARKRLA